MGLYIDSNAAKTELSALRNVDIASYTPSHFKSIVDTHSVSKAIRLVMTRTVSGEQMASAIGEAVESRLKVLGSSRTAAEREAMDAAFKQFVSNFKKPELVTGTEIIILMDGNGVMSLTVAGSTGEPINSKELCSAFVDVYLGDEAVVDRTLLLGRMQSLLA